MNDQSVLDEMTRGIMGRKAEKATQLTPVGLERPLPKIGAAFPNDHPTEVVESAVKAIRREVGHILDALDAIDATNGVPSVVPSTLVPDPKASEREADEKHARRPVVIVKTDEEPEPFPTRFERLSQQAQEATYRDAEAEPESVGWTCPKHGADHTVTLTSRKGRLYRACNLAECPEFEK